MRINHFERYLKTAIENLELDSIESANHSGNFTIIKNWEAVCITLLRLSEYSFLQFYTEEIFNLGGSFSIPAKELKLRTVDYNKFFDELVIFRNTLKTIQETINSFSPQDEADQINIKLPDQISLSEMSEYISEINSVFNKMQALRKINDGQDYNLLRVEAGSTWLIVGVGVTSVIGIIGAIVKVAREIQDMVIKHKTTTQTLRVLKSGANMVEALEKEMTEELTRECAARAKDFNTEHQLGLDHEEIGSLSKGFDKLGHLFFKGVQIYA